MQISYSIWPPKDENMALFGHTLQKKLVGQITSKSEEICTLHLQSIKHEQQCKLEKYHNNNQIKPNNSGLQL